jgi:D-alanine-D-alanine ligase
LEYGKNISKILTELGMEVLEMHLHPNGSWTVNGEVQNVEEALKKTDKVWNCLVGVDGERGVVESLCEKCKTKVVGHTHLHSHLSSDKKNLHLALAQHNIKFPHGKVIRKKDYSKEKVLEIFSTVPVPAIVKPNSGSSVFGLFVVNNFPELEHAVETLVSQGEDVLVEKLIKGTPVSCFVFEHNNLLHTHIKSEGDVELSREDAMNIRNEALYIHNILAFKHHAEYDFLLTPKGLVFLEINSHPSLTSGYIGKVFKSGVVPLADYVANKV